MKLNFSTNLFAFIPGSLTVWHATKRSYSHRWWAGFILILLFIFPANVLPQDLDITPYLKKIEAGEKQEVIEKILGLKKTHPSSSSVIYLEALLTEDGEKAFQIYKSLVDKFPNSKYADDAIYRIYTYFSAIDKTDKAEFYLNRLKTEYAESPYIKLASKITFSEDTRVTVKTEENKTPIAVKEKSVEKEFKYTVQAGAFTRKDNALKLKTDFDKAGYTSQVVEKSVGGSIFHVVNAGKFITDEEAKSFLNLINVKFKLQGWVVKLD